MTASNQMFKLSPPFLCWRRKTPEQEGTYPLPEAQLDRFMFNIRSIIPMLTKKRRLLWRRRVGARLNCGRY